MPPEVEDKPLLTEKPAKADDDTALLDQLIGDKSEEDEIEVEEKPDEEEEVISEEDEEIKEPDKEDLLEVDTNTRAIDFSKIKEKYPDFAKTNDYRELKNAYYREGKLTELFPTIEDAREAAENNETFNKINHSLINNGDASVLLNAIKGASPESFKKVASSFLEVLHKTDNGVYVETITPIVKGLARQIYSAGQTALKRNPDSDDGKALVATARNIMQYAFQDADAIDKNDEPRIDPKLAEKEQELQNRENAIRNEKFTSAYSVAESAVERHLDKTILEGLDPDGKLNEFTRDALLEKIKNEVKDQIGKDQLHIRKMTSLWKRSEAAGFNRESLSRIVAAYLERARPIIPTVRNKFRSKAITDKKEPNSEDLKIVSRGRSGRAPERDGKVNLRNIDPKKVNYKETSDDDILNGKVKLRG